MSLLLPPKKAKKRFQDIEKETKKYCDKFCKDIDKIWQDERNGKYKENGRTNFNKYFQELDWATDSLLSYAKSLHRCNYKPRGKDFASRQRMHFIMQEWIEDTPYNIFYQGKGLYEKYKNKRISDIIMEIMQEPYGL